MNWLVILIFIFNLGGFCLSATFNDASFIEKAAGATGLGSSLGAILLFYQSNSRSEDIKKFEELIENHGVGTTLTAESLKDLVKRNFDRSHLLLIAFAGYSSAIQPFSDEALQIVQILFRLFE